VRSQSIRFLANGSISATGDDRGGISEPRLVLNPPATLVLPPKMTEASRLVKKLLERDTRQSGAVRTRRLDKRRAI